MGNISFSFYENKPSKQVHVPVCFSKKGGRCGERKKPWSTVSTAALGTRSPTICLLSDVVSTRTMRSLLCMYRACTYFYLQLEVFCMKKWPLHFKLNIITERSKIKRAYWCMINGVITEKWKTLPRFWPEQSSYKQATAAYSNVLTIIKGTLSHSPLHSS